MLFTFLTITYNHENFILQHLESMKYQIVNYGKDMKFQLIIADDCSKDRTIEYVNKWLKINGHLFEYIDILENEVNKGTCKNYTKGIKNIKGDYYKSLAGDDIFAKDNIFEAIALLDKYDIVCTTIGPFYNTSIFKNYKIYNSIYLMYRFTNMDYEKIAKNYITIPMTPGIFMRKELMTAEVIDFINQFHLIEDRPKNIKIYEQNKNLNIGNFNKILVLYRHHNKAVTKTPNEKIAKLFNKDSMELYDYVLNNTSSICQKIKVLNKKLINNMKNKRLASILDIDMFSFRVGFLLNYFKYKNKMDNIIENSYLPNEEYLKEIIREAKKYENEFSI